MRDIACASSAAPCPWCGQDHHARVGGISMRTLFFSSMEKAVVEMLLSENSPMLET
jgi:hypothetical protein